MWHLASRIIWMVPKIVEIHLCDSLDIFTFHRLQIFIKIFFNFMNPHSKVKKLQLFQKLKWHWTNVILDNDNLHICAYVTSLNATWSSSIWLFLYRIWYNRNGKKGEFKLTSKWNWNKDIRLLINIRVFFLLFKSMMKCTF